MSDRITDEELTALELSGLGPLVRIALAELRSHRARELTTDEAKNLRGLAEILSRVTWIEGAEWSQVLASRTILDKLTKGRT